MSGAWSMMVMLMLVLSEPPLLLAQTVYVTGLVCKTVAIPQMVPLLVPNVKPLGSAGLMAHEVMAPEPVRVGVSGKSLLAWFLVSVKLSGKYESDGTSSTTVILR